MAITFEVTLHHATSKPLSITVYAGTWGEAAQTAFESLGTNAIKQIDVRRLTSEESLQLLKEKLS